MFESVDTFGRRLIEFIIIFLLVYWCTMRIRAKEGKVMKKKLTTIVLALLMTMMFATAGVFAAPEDNDAEKSDYWKVEATEVTDSSAVIVWNPADDEDYEHKADAVFNIYRLRDDGEKELIAENVMSKSAAAKVEVGEGEEEPLVYVYNDKEDAKDKDGKDIPLGYYYKLDKLEAETEYELIIEEKTETEENMYQAKSGRVIFETSQTDVDNKDSESKKENSDSDKNESDTNSTNETAKGDEPKKLSTKGTTTADTSYRLSAGKSSVTEKTAVLSWKANSPIGNNAFEINGRKVNPTRNNDGSYSYKVTGLGAGNKYTYKLNVVNGSGQVISNTMNFTVDTSYRLSAGKLSVSGNSAVLNWKTNFPISSNAFEINGKKVNPARNYDGSYSYKVTGLNVGDKYTYKVNVVNGSSKVISNTMNFTVDKSYRLSAGKASVTEKTAVLSWKSNFPLNGNVEINKISPTKNSDGSYSYKIKGLGAGNKYTYKVKVVNGSSKVISNTMNYTVDTSYSLFAGKTSVTEKTAVLSWKSNFPLSSNIVEVNGNKVSPTKNSDGSYSYKITGLGAGNKYTYKVRVVNGSGKVISNTMNFTVDTSYVLSEGKAIGVTEKTAVLNWRSNFPLNSNMVEVNGYKVTPTRNSDGTYSVKVSGLGAGHKYSFPVRVVNGSGKVISNTINITVDTANTIRTMQVQFTFAEPRTLTSYSGGSVQTYFKQGFTTTCTGFENGRYQFVYDGRIYFVNRLSTTNQKIVSSAFDKTYSAATATNYVNSLGISSSTGYLIWVNTYTQKMYIFTGSKGNWRLAQGPWVVSTGKPTTMTSTGLAQIRQKDYYDRNLYYWNVVSYFSIHGKVSEWVLGYPASDGCVRNTDDHASFVYYNCPIGTAVYVY